jgi:hypothetical protein
MEVGGGERMILVIGIIWVIGAMFTLGYVAESVLEPEEWWKRAGLLFLLSCCGQ